MLRHSGLDVILFTPVHVEVSQRKRVLQDQLRSSSINVQSSDIFSIIARRHVGVGLLGSQTLSGTRGLGNHHRISDRPLLLPDAIARIPIYRFHSA